MKLTFTIALAASLLAPLSARPEGMTALRNPPMFLLGITNHLWHPDSNYLMLSRIVATNGPSLDTYNTNWNVTNLNTSVQFSNYMLPFRWSIPPSNFAWLQDAGPINAAGTWGSVKLPEGAWEVSWDVKRGLEAGTFMVQPELWLSTTNLSTNVESFLVAGNPLPVSQAKQTLKHTIPVTSEVSTLTNNLHQIVLLRMRAISVRGTNRMSLYLGGTNSYLRVPQAYQITTSVTNLMSNALTAPIRVGGSEFSISIVGRGPWAGNNCTNWLAAGFLVSPDGVNWTSEYATNSLLWHLTSPLGSNTVVSYTTIGSGVLLNGAPIVGEIGSPSYISSPIQYIQLAWITNGLPGAATNPFWMSNIIVNIRPRI